ncbi:MAG: TIGR01244 family sulfur transferase [Caldimonas sp.]
MPLAVQQLTADIAVAPQLDAAAIAEAAVAGFRSVINNRPDFEGGPGQPTSASVETAARAAGLEYAWLPVTPGVQTSDDIARFAALLDTLPRPILAFCRTGTRSGNLVRAVLGS